MKWKLGLNKKKVLFITLVFIIGFVIISNINFSQKGIEIIEQETAEGKIITVSGEDGLENVLASTELSKEELSGLSEVHHFMKEYF